MIGTAVWAGFSREAILADRKIPRRPVSRFTKAAALGKDRAFSKIKSARR
jgi:hypothetical protein